MAVPYVLTSALYLESQLNDKITEYVEKRFDVNVPHIISAYQSMNLKGELCTIVSLLTDNIYRINTEHYVYQRLTHLIKIRNQLAHTKSVYEDMTVEIRPWPILYQFPEEYFEKIDDITMGATETFSPLQYHEALEKLGRWFFDRCDKPERLKASAIVVRNKNHNDTPPHEAPVIVPPIPKDWPI